MLKSVDITISAGQKRGKIRAVNGVCNAPPLAVCRYLPDVLEDMKCLHIPYSRFHDAPLENPGMALVDISCVFPNFKADASNPDNYNFEATDDYLARCAEYGSKIEYRLGESIELSEKKYRVRPPADFAHFAEICVHIIRHYNCGWANGFHWGIEDWSIWEEPDNNNLFAGEFDDFLKLYEVVAKRIKQEFPDLRVGGPNALGGNDTEKFLQFCKANQVPVDFYGYTYYHRTPGRQLDQIYAIRKLLDDNGFAETALELAEWHYAPADWRALYSDPKRKPELMQEVSGENSAAFVAAVLCGMQDAPVDMAYLYCISYMAWGLFDEVLRTPLKNYFALKAFGKMLECDCRVDASVSENCNTWILAGRKGDEIFLLASCFKSGMHPVSITLDEEFNSYEVLVVDDRHDLSEETLREVKFENNRLSFSKDYAGSQIYVFRFFNKK